MSYTRFLFFKDYNVGTLDSLNLKSEFFVAVGESGTILTSSDGTTWTSRTSGTSQGLDGVSYGDSTFVAVGVIGTILTSSDGASWTSRTSGTSYNLYGVSYGGRAQY